MEDLVPQGVLISVKQTENTVWVCTIMLIIVICL